MWIIGVMNKNEMRSLIKGGYDVKVVDELEFNKLLDSKHNFAESCREIDEGDVLAATFTDADMFEELSKCIERKENDQKRAKEEMMYARRHDFAEDCFSHANNELLEIPDDSEVVEREGWVDDGDNRLTLKFYYSSPSGGDSEIGTFVVVFDENSVLIADCYSNTH